MTRIADYASHTQLTGYLLDIQSRVYEADIQVATEKKSQDYTGIATDSQRLVHLENLLGLTDNYISNNGVVEMRLSAVETTYSALETTMRDFRERLFNYEQNETTLQEYVEDMQTWAFQALIEMEGYLNFDIDGQYLFSGSKVHTEPVELNLTTLADFQATYDGNAITYPTTYDSHVQQTIDAASGHPDPTLATGHGGVAIGGGGTTVTAAVAGAFANVPLGTTIEFADDPGNSYTVVGNDGTVLTLSAATASAGGAVTLAINNSYYQGDEQVASYRINENREVTLDSTAEHPAFEKAIRAISIIAQGVFGTAGGLDQHPERIQEAIYLINSALGEPVGNVQPASLGTVPSGSIAELNFRLAFDQVLVKDTNAWMNKFSNFLKTQVSAIEDVDKTEAITRLLDEQRALEASYQAFATVRQLSLSNFL